MGSTQVVGLLKVHGAAMGVGCGGVLGIASAFGLIDGVESIP